MNSRFFEINNLNVEIAQDLKYGYAGEVWDAALVLSHFLANKKELHDCTVNNKVVLEFGAGTGVCGIVCAVLGANRVYLTDKEENLGIIEQNYKLNQSKINNCDVVISSLNWFKPEEFANIKKSVDVIVCSDVVWNPENFDALVNTFEYFVKPETNQVILAYQYRKKSDLEFFEKLKSKNFAIQRVPESLLDEEYRAEDIFIVIIKKL